MSELELKVVEIGGDKPVEPDKTWRVDIPVWATVYIKADTEEEATAKLRTLQCTELTMNPLDFAFNDEADDGLSLSPVATIDCNLNRRIDADEIKIEIEEE